MTSNRRAFTLAAMALAVTVAVAAGCGNYSNEDLEFMNALPDATELSANLRDAMSTVNEAELARDTHNAVKGFNDILNTVLGLVQAIRTYEPSARGPDSRTWGPVPAEQAGWQWQFVMVRAPDGSFSYHLDLELIGATDAWRSFLTGSFAPSPGVRRGVGSFTLATAPLRTAGFPFDAKTGPIDTLTLTYQTKDFPISVSVDWVTYPNYPDLSTTNSVHYEFGAQADGSGAMKFTMTGDLITVTPAIEVVSVTSRWLPSGAGRADLTVEQGDGAGMMQSECWDSSFNATYNSKPWSPTENLNDPSFCAALPAL